MKEIVKVLLAEGIDEETIHEVLDIIEENYEIVDEELEKDGPKITDPEGRKDINFYSTNHNINKRANFEAKRKGEEVPYKEYSPGLGDYREPNDEKTFRSSGRWGGRSDRGKVTNPDYQHFKKVAKKALKGHEKEAIMNLPSYEGRKPSTNATALYRLGRKVSKSRGELKESYSLKNLLGILEELKDSVKKSAPKLRELDNRINWHTDRYEKLDNPEKPSKLDIQGDLEKEHKYRIDNLGRNGTTRYPAYKRKMNPKVKVKKVKPKASTNEPSLEDRYRKWQEDRYEGQFDPHDYDD